jgi:hypothetical protein
MDVSEKYTVFRTEDKDIIFILNVGFYVLVYKASESRSITLLAEIPGVARDSR